VPEVLFTNLSPVTEIVSYVLAIWTNEKEETDFEFYLSGLPARSGNFNCSD